MHPKHAQPSGGGPSAAQRPPRQAPDRQRPPLQAPEAGARARQPRSPDCGQRQSGAACAGERPPSG
eukprot:14007747-Alexandrium_andersonii.AAC.1